jgi:hypothetical protein
MSGSGDLFDNFFGPTGSTARKPASDNQRPLPSIRGKRIDGELYVLASDVAAALATQAPVTNQRLIAKLRGAS